MVTGALARNRKKRRNINYSNEDRIKILSGEDITLEKIYSIYNSGCLITLDNINKLNKSEKKGIVHEVNWEKRKIIYAFSVKDGLSLEEYLFESTKKPNSYRIKAVWGIPNHQIYDELNEKLKKLNKN